VPHVWRRRAPSSWRSSEWDRSLEAAGKADKSRQTYRKSATQFVIFLREHGLPTQAHQISREHVKRFVVDLRGRWKSATANNRYRGLAQLFRYLLEDGEIAEWAHGPDAAPKSARGVGARAGRCRFEEAPGLL
jgi:site-specific recombinase XerD